MLEDLFRRNLTLYKRSLINNVPSKSAPHIRVSKWRDSVWGLLEKTVFSTLFRPTSIPPTSSYPEDIVVREPFDLIQDLPVVAFARLLVVEIRATVKSRKKAELWRDLKHQQPRRCW